MQRGQGTREQQIRRLQSEAERAARMDMPVPGRFLAGEDRALALHEAAGNGLKAAFDGGWTDAERVQVCFHPAQDEPVFTAEWVEISWNARFAHPEHRDLFGSLMGLGIDRSYFGDLILQTDRAFLYVLPEVAVRLPGEWDQAGRNTIRVRQLDEPPAIIPPEGQHLRDTVASLRLDSVLSAGMRISRSRAAEIIRQGLVSVDHTTEERTDRILAEGALLSIRGFGRIRVREIGRMTKKERLPVELEIFSGK